MEEVLRIRELMGLKSFLKEGLYGLTKMLLKEDTTIGELMLAFKTALRKAGGELTDQEKIYMSKLVDEYNARFADEYGFIDFTGKIDNQLRSVLTSVMEKETDDVLVDFWAGAVQRVTRSNIGKEGIEHFPTLDDAMKEAMQSEKVSDDLVNSEGQPLGVYDTLVFIFQKGGVRQSELPDSVITLLKDQLAYYRGVLGETDPLKKYCDDVVDQIDEMQTGETKLLPEEDITIIRNELPAIEDNIKNPVSPYVADVTDDWTIDLGSGDDLGLGGSAVDKRKEAINAVMADMEKKCKVGFCKTMVAYYKKDNKKFEDMWSYIYQKLSAGMKAKAQSRFNAEVSQNVLDEYQLILKEFSKQDTPVTPDQYIELGEQIYKKMKSSGQLGVFGGVFTPFKDMGVFTSKDMMYRSLGYVLLGSDPFKGGWTFKGMWDRWWKLNLIWFPVVLTHNIIEAGKGSEDPTTSSLDQFIDLMLSSAWDTMTLGFAPGPRLFIEGFSLFVNEKTAGSKYVDFPTLVEYLNSKHGWTENQIYDNIINNGHVTTFRESTPAYTKISGATDIYAVANGKYEIVVKNIIKGIFSNKVTFTPEGASKPEPAKDKTAKIDREARTEIKKIIADESFISDSIGKNLIGNKNVDFDRQETLDENGTKSTLLIYKVVNSLDKKAEVTLNYDAWVAAGKPEIKTEENWNKYAKVKLL
jgi:hypothetical protein